MKKCGYCPKPLGEGWCDCPGAQAAKKRLGDTLKSIDDMFRGGQEPITGKTEMEERWNQKARDKAQASIRTQIAIQKGKQ